MASKRITRSAAAKLTQEAAFSQDPEEQDPNLAGVKMVAEVQTPASKRKTLATHSPKEDVLLSSQEKHEASHGDVQSAGRESLTIEVPALSSPPQRSRKAEIRDSDEESAGEDETPFKTPLERKRIVFDEDEHEEFVTPMEAPLRNPLETAASAPVEVDEEDGGSDDDAPEAISLHAAKAQSAKSSQAAWKAVEREADAKRQRRKHRDAFFAEQKRSRRAAKATSSKPELFGVADEGNGPAEPEGAAAVGPSEPPRKRKLEAPGLLPPELLDSDEDEVEALCREQLSLAKPKKTKLDVAERQAKHAVPRPQDERIGSTVYRVMAERGNDRLAVRANKESYQLREKLLARHRLPEKKGGFLVKRR